MLLRNHSGKLRKETPMPFPIAQAHASPPKLLDKEDTLDQTT